MRIIIIGLLMSWTALASSILVSIDQADQITGPGSFVSFSGTITNTGAEDVFLNGASVTLPYFELNFDLTPFFTLVPPVLAPSDSFAGDIFTVAVSGAALPDDYFGSLSFQGGVDSNAFDDLAIQSFQVTVSDVPEPNSALLLIGGLSLLGGVYRTVFAIRKRRLACL